MAFRRKDIATACGHLSACDPHLGRIMQRVGPFSLKTKRDYFLVLANSIVSQQISTAAARTIMQRVTDHVFPNKVSAASLAALTADQLKSLGVSSQKARYLHDLSSKVADGTICLKQFSRKSDQEIIAELIQVKGIGVWTVQMFLIFALGRPDVLPTGDLGIQNAIRRVYQLSDLPSPSEIEQIASPWRPYASIASWYLWRSLALS